jgi:hypothetical protein
MAPGSPGAGIPATSGGYARLLAWMGSFGRLHAVGVEGTGSYGGGLARYLHGQGVTVIEVRHPRPSAAAGQPQARPAGCLCCRRRCDRREGRRHRQGRRWDHPGPSAPCTWPGPEPSRPLPPPPASSRASWLLPPAGPPRATHRDRHPGADRRLHPVAPARRSGHPRPRHQDRAALPGPPAARPSPPRSPPWTASSPRWSPGPAPR